MLTALGAGLLTWGVAARRAAARPGSAQFVPAPGFRPGESPQTALRGALADVMPQLRCGCGGGYSQVSPAPTRIRYEDGELLLTTLRCRQCASQQDFYLADWARQV